MRTPSHSPGQSVPGPANSRSARLVTTIGIWITLLVVVGACDKNKPVSNPYFGPTLPLDQLIDQINQRNARVESVWADGSFEATLIDPDSKHLTTGSGDVILLYMPPKNLRLVGRVLGNRIFEIGSNQDRYWFISYDKTDTMWWGYHRLVDPKGTGVLPVRPDLMAEVLGVGPINSDLLKEPFPVVRFNNDQRAYMLTWQVLLSDRWVVQKEVWYDVQTLLPRLVLLFDQNGRVVLRAYLSGYREVQGYEPVLQMASEYDLFFPESGSTFLIRLSELRRESTGVPTPRSFNFPGQNAGVSKVIQVDE
jgi:hypothetical protein